MKLMKAEKRNSNLIHFWCMSEQEYYSPNMIGAKMSVEHRLKYYTNDDVTITIMSS
jgi:hypothetical protein